MLWLFSKRDGLCLTYGIRAPVAASCKPIMTRPATVARYRSLFTLGSFHLSKLGDMDPLVSSV